jgi:hypothetical protein
MAARKSKREPPTGGRRQVSACALGAFSGLAEQGEPARLGVRCKAPALRPAASLEEQAYSRKDHTHIMGAVREYACRLRTVEK